MNRIVFLDRDGLINKKAPEHEYIKTVEEFVFLPGVFDAARRLCEEGFLLIVVTNQRGIARGIMSGQQVNNIHSFMKKEFSKHGIVISNIYVCPHEKGTCSCRKPNIGLFLQAEKDFCIDKENSWMIGDSDSDVLAGQRYGVKTIKTCSLAEAVEIIIGRGK